MALLWAAGIVWFALDTAGSGGDQTANALASNETALTDDSGMPVSNADAEVIGDALNRM